MAHPEAVSLAMTLENEQVCCMDRRMCQHVAKVDPTFHNLVKRAYKAQNLKCELPGCTHFRHP